MGGGRSLSLVAASGMCRVSACPPPCSAKHTALTVLILDGCFAPRRGVDTNSIFAVWPINCNLGAGLAKLIYTPRRQWKMEIQYQQIEAGALNIVFYSDESKDRELHQEKAWDV